MAISTLPRVRRPATRLEHPLPERPTVLRAESSLLELTVLVVVIAAIAVIAGFVVVGSISGPGYQATIENVVPYTSSEVIVDFQVKNLGESPATPTCVIDTSSSAFAVTGEGSMTAGQPLPAQAWATYHVVIPVTSGGATSVGVGASSVTCH